MSTGRPRGHPTAGAPDGRTIAFEIRRYDSTGDSLAGSVVATVPVAGGTVQRLTSPDRFMVHPSWRTTGDELVMNDLGPAAEPSNLWVLKPGETELRALTDASVDGHMRIETPRWDPDGTRILVSIVYSTGPDLAFGGDVRLAFIDGDGGEPQIISTLAGRYPDMQPTP